MRRPPACQPFTLPLPGAKGPRRFSRLHASPPRACLQRVGHEVADLGGVDPHQAVGRMGGVEHGPQHVERGAHLEGLQGRAGRGESRLV